ncbi:NAD-dependent epimerase/dehydratase family protein [Nocardia sp. SC052]|uniref:NAD-dependent epimerase/dehydratase family protein n=1 Tax=Nocardia sichangensis TaxID=3385975 RepID=UPI0039A25CAA
MTQLAAAPRALVTGADGFIGSHLVDALIDDGYHVIATVRRTSRSQIDRRFTNLTAERVEELGELLCIDLAGPDAIDTLARVEADVWFHLAADAYVPASFGQPRSVVATNIASTANVLEAARIAAPRHLLVTSSSEVYGSHGDPITEKDALYPSTPYAASKVACDRLAYSYHFTYGLPLTIVRPFNCYGPRHVYDVVPIFLRRALAGEPVVVNGTGLQTRDLSYVADTVAAFISLSRLSGSGEVYNISTGRGTGVLELATEIVSLTNSDSRIVHGERRLGEVDDLVGDSSKLRQATGWRPKWDLAGGLRANIDWMRGI